MNPLLTRYSVSSFGVIWAKAHQRAGPGMQLNDNINRRSCRIGRKSIGGARLDSCGEKKNRHASGIFPAPESRVAPSAEYQADPVFRLELPFEQGFIAFAKKSALFCPYRWDFSTESSPGSGHGPTRSYLSRSQYLNGGAKTSVRICRGGFLLYGQGRRPIRLQAQFRFRPSRTMNHGARINIPASDTPTLNGLPGQRPGMEATWAQSTTTATRPTTIASKHISAGRWGGKKREPEGAISQPS